ncbi:MAG: hypothetical protein JWL60_1086, partial [Gemmatimonadetes bacterium]|nr:hypothetical protein [Gemmatimonadota bacterium]
MPTQLTRAAVLALAAVAIAGPGGARRMEASRAEGHGASGRMRRGPTATGGAPAAPRP